MMWNLPSAHTFSAKMSKFEDIKFLEFSGGFDDSVQDIAWPHRLRQVEFGRFFNSEIEGVRSLIFG